MSDYISREDALRGYTRLLQMPGEIFVTEVSDMLQQLPAADVRPVPEGGIGEMSDGYHTFNGLYYQRMILFAALVKAYKDKAWKSYRHEDGEPCFGGGWFIVGIDTPEGSYTYHYENKDFDLFDCEELPVAKHWDGHTEVDVTRLLSLPAADVREVVKKPVVGYEGLSNGLQIRLLERMERRARSVRTYQGHGDAEKRKYHSCYLFGWNYY